MNLSKVCSYTDFFIICNGTNRRHVAAIAEGIRDDLRALAVRPLGIEGLDAQRWVLVDFSDVIVHVFDPDMRGFYDLESLWSDAPRMPIPAEPPPPQPAA